MRSVLKSQKGGVMRERECVRGLGMTIGMEKSDLGLCL